MSAHSQSGLVFTTNSIPAGAAGGNALYAIATSGGSDLVAVGAKSTVFSGIYTATANGSNTFQWTTGSVPVANLNLEGITYGSGTYVADASVGNVFTGSGTSWTSAKSITGGSGLELWGISYNPSANNTYAVAAGPYIYSTANPATGWQLKLTSSSELFYGMTAYANGFAACGNTRAVLISSDGLTWPAAPAPSGTYNLSGAVVGGGTLVCVGDETAATGTAISSANPTQAGSWTAKNFGSIGLNKVAYTGAEFVAVGNKGAFLSSPDGVTWTTNQIAYNSSSGSVIVTNNIYAISFSTNGPLQGVGVLVGANGTVMLCGSNPIAPAFISSETICAGSANPTLSVNLANSGSVSNWITVDWYSSASGGAPIAIATNSFTPETNYPDVDATYTFYAESRDTRTELVSTNRTPVSLTVFQRPTANVTASGTTNVCNGEEATLSVELTGTGPWTVGWSDNTISNYTTSPGLKTVNLTNSDPNIPLTNSFTVSSLSDANCSADSIDLSGSVTVTVYPIPISTLTTDGDTNVCSGEPAVVSANLTGFGPWVVTWNDGTTATVGSGPGPFKTSHTTAPLNDPNANLTNSASFWITNLYTTTGNTCPATNMAGTNTVTIYPIPTAMLTNSDSTNVCGGESVLLSAQLTGVGPWVVQWSDGASQTVGAGPGPFVVKHLTAPLNDPNSNATSSALFSITNLYTTTGNTCPATNLLGTDMVTIYPIPTATLTDAGTNICSGESALISATLTGIGPWVVQWNDGTNQTVGAGPGPFLVNHVTAPLNNSDSNHTSSALFSITNLYTTTGNTCPATNLLETETVTVYPIPTATVTAAGGTNVCGGQPAVVSATLTGVGPWVVQWNDGTNETVGSGPGPFVAAHVTAPLTDSSPNSTSNVSFWITALDTTTGNTCPATNIMGTNTLTIYPVPTATVTLLGAASGQTNIYSGTTVTNQVVLTGYGPWTVDWSDGSSTNVSGTNGPVTIQHSVTPTNLYSLMTSFSNSVQVRAISSNVSTNYYYYITSLTAGSGDTCDITAPATTNTVTVWVPWLTVMPQDTNVVVSWFAAAPSSLEWTADFASPYSNTVWTVVGTNSVLDATNYWTNSTAGSTNGFYRLSLDGP
ncbi:MAG TPA: hypothetical protein VH595_10825 [Verrucomicrobiae bacterium]|nr:hypothetical protein [Verrucomicrobiae bacterium]